MIYLVSYFASVQITFLSLLNGLIQIFVIDVLKTRTASNIYKNNILVLDEN